MRLPRKIILLLALLLPWPIRRLFYIYFFDYKIPRSCRVGFSYLDATEFAIGSGSKIRHFNVIRGLQILRMGEFTSIGNLNWITGLPLSNKVNFTHNTNRLPALMIGNHSSITNRHLIDCTHTVEIGEFSTFAGFRSQILTHSIDLIDNIQNSKPVIIGNYSFVGTGCIILPGSGLPSYSLLAAGSVLTKAHLDPGYLYGGIPAGKIRGMPMDSKYFQRTTG